jgi:hypothetical protein
MLTLEPKRAELLANGLLGANLLDLGILKLLTAGLPHLELLNGAYLLEQAADLLVLRAAVARASDGKIGGGCVRSLDWSRSPGILATLLLTNILALLAALLSTAVGAVAVRALLARAPAVSVASILTVAALTAVMTIATFRASTSRSGGRIGS